MWKSPKSLLLAAAVATVSIGAAQAQDIAAGEKVFAKCKACHMVGENAKNRVGPILNGIVGRAAGTVDGFKYSPAMAKAGADGLLWDEANLSGYLRDPKGFLKGNKMAFAGLKKDEEVVDVIAYLESFDADGKPATPAKQSQAPAGAAAAVTTADAAGPSRETTGSVTEAAGLKLGLGRTATPEEIAAWDTDVRPDGEGLPEGSGTVAHGMEIYDERCASCHGDFGEAIGRWPVLAGGQGTLQAERPEKTIGSYWPYLSTVFDYVHRAMPFGDARSLSNDDVYALTAYLLYLNDIVDDESFELSKENFTSIRLPNEDNFFDDDRDEEPFYADKSEPCMTDCKPGAPEITMHAAVLDVTPEDGGEENASGGGID
ncbi:c-type cytochrome [Aquibium carbonis]|uniref:C-type cytochrome n=1 Tax=Aquibium carbonis TaxID=2495581 RepID=A0A429YSI3_9HYPH|nr:c-type cytochrome [Aquibium carbonis]RST84401.1 c-type cytochrome [Aquibium carbonis]